MDDSILDDKLLVEETQLSNSPASFSKRLVNRLGINSQQQQPCTQTITLPNKYKNINSLNIFNHDKTSYTAFTLHRHSDTLLYSWQLKHFQL